jgi:hypothetical protein
MSAEDERLMTAGEAATVLRVSPDTVKRMAQRGEIVRRVPRGRRVFYSVLPASLIENDGEPPSRGALLRGRVMQMAKVTASGGDVVEVVARLLDHFEAAAARDYQRRQRLFDELQHMHQVVEALLLEQRTVNARLLDVILGQQQPPPPAVARKPAAARARRS